MELLVKAVKSLKLAEENDKSAQELYDEISRERPHIYSVSKDLQFYIDRYSILLLIVQLPRFCVTFRCKNKEKANDRLLVNKLLVLRFVFPDVEPSLESNFKLNDVDQCNHRHHHKKWPGYNEHTIKPICLQHGSSNSKLNMQ